MSGLVTDRLDLLAPEFALALAKARFGPGVDMGGRHNPLPTEIREGQRMVEMIKYVLSDEWLTWCHPDAGHHSNPHRGCILR